MSQLRCAVKLAGPRFVAWLIDVLEEVVGSGGGQWFVFCVHVVVHPGACRVAL